jgi:hypothetical protein
MTTREDRACERASRSRFGSARVGDHHAHFKAERICPFGPCECAASASLIRTHPGVGRPRRCAYGAAMDPAVVQLAVRLSEVALRNTAGRIADRLQAAKTKRNDAETIAEMDEIIASLIADKNEIIQIAQAFEQELVAQRISDEDITYVTSTVVPLVERLAAAMGDDDEELSAQEAIELLKPLLSAETLKVLQLLGFNFKQAVGEPLTLLLRGLILAQVPAQRSQTVDLGPLGELLSGINGDGS